jgi:hypothetical protein
MPNGFPSQIAANVWLSKALAGPEEAPEQSAFL